MYQECSINYFLLGKKATIHQLTTSKNVLFPGHNHLLTTDADGPSLLLSPLLIIKVSGYLYWWLACGYDLEIGHI